MQCITFHNRLKKVSTFFWDPGYRTSSLYWITDICTVTFPNSFTFDSNSSDHIFSSLLLPVYPLLRFSYFLDHISYISKLICNGLF